MYLVIGLRLWVGGDTGNEGRATFGDRVNNPFFLSFGDGGRTDDGSCFVKKLNGYDV